MRGTRRNLLAVSDRSFSGSAFESAPAGGRLFAVVEAHPRLAVAVVVGRPDEECRVAPSDPNSLVSLRLGATPDADEGILPALAPDRRLVGVPRQDARAVRQLEEDLHHRPPYGRHVPAPHRVAEKRVPR